MINIRLATEDDKEDWNKVVEQSDNGTIYHTWEWKQVIEQGLGDKGYHVIAEKDGEIVGIFPLFSRASLKYSKSPSFLKEFFQVLWSPHVQTWGYGGPCILGNDEEIFKKLYDFVDNLVKKNRRIISLRVFPYKNFIEKNCQKNNFTSFSWQTAYIDLSKNRDELWTSINKKHRTAVRKGRKEGLNVVVGRKKSEIKEFYEYVWIDLVRHVTNKTERQMMYSPKFLAYEYFKTIWDTLVPKKLAKFYFVYYNDKIISGLVIFYYKNLAIYEHGASIRAYLKLSPNNLLLWTAIENAKDDGYEIFDLAGMGSPSVPFAEKDGVFRFKAGWSGELKQLKWYYKDYRLKGIRNIKKKFFH